MSNLEAVPGLLSEVNINQNQKSGIAENTLATTQAENQSGRLRWQQLIDHKLIEWGKDPSVLEDDGLEAPSRSVIQLACEIAKCLCDSNAPPPLRIVPDGEGGIVFERRNGSIFTSLEIQNDGTVELLIFRNSRLHSRQRLI